MNCNIPLLTAALATLAILTSCEGVSTGGGNGQVINNPTVEDMARLEAQWGMEPRAVKPRFREAGPSDFVTPSAAPTPVEPAPQAAPPVPPAPAPQETIQPAVPAAPPAIPPSLR